MTAITAFQGEYRWLSNFWPCSLFPIDVRGEMLTPATVEHAYQAAKFTDWSICKGIILAPTPGVAKRLGQGAAVRSDWEQVKLEAMDTFVAQKFSSLNPDLCARLTVTGDAEIVEGNTWGDRFWGVCGGVGENHFGRIIMARRAELRA